MPFILHQKLARRPSLFLKPGFSRSHKGIIIPMVIGVLTIFFILIMVLSQGSSDIYRQTSLINHRTHARFMAIGAMEEIHDLLWNMLSNPMQSTNKRLEMLTSIIAGGSYEMDLHSELKLAHNIELKQKKTKTLSNSASTAILEASVKFHNFKLIPYTRDNSLYANPTTYYRSPDGGSGGRPAAGPMGTHPDFYGWMTVKVKSQHGLVTKSIEQSRPVKIITATPMGKDYVVFEMEPSQMQSLNDGPGFYINGNVDGRIRIVGPYQLDVEGKSNGKAKSFSRHKKSVGGKSYPRKFIGLRNNVGDKWFNDSWIPSPKVVSTCSWTHGSRPYFMGGFGQSYPVPYAPICCPNIPLTLDLTPPMMEATNQQWIAGSIDKGKQNFSLTGIDGRQAFKGLVYKNNAKYGEPDGVTEDFNPEPGTQIRHEGIIIGNYKTFGINVPVRFPVPVPPGVIPLVPWGGFSCSYMWTGGEKQPIQALYAFRGDEKPEVNWSGIIIGALTDAVGGLMLGGSLKGLEGGWKIAGAYAKGIGGMLIADQLLGDSLKVGDHKAIDPADIPNVFPEGFRMVSRAAVRHFATLDEALSGNGKLLLDGIFWVDNMTAKKDLKYIGKGTIAQLSSGLSAPAELKQVRPERENRDFLNIFYLDPQNALRLNGKEIHASIYAHASVNPLVNTLIRGNLMTSRIRKKDMEKSLGVTYWFQKLSGISDEDYQKNYRIVSMSPKIEAYSEVSFAKKSGTGDDGVEPILGTIGE